MRSDMSLYWMMSQMCVRPSGGSLKELAQELLVLANHTYSYAEVFQLPLAHHGSENA
jgi:hypothetical protein